jgi:F0F1-type ATP synthase assembly protein I
MDEKSKNDGNLMSALGMAMNIGYMIIIPILFFGIGGVILDKKLNIFPVFTFIGFLLAMGSGLWIVYTKTKDIVKMGIPPKKTEPLEKNNKIDNKD